MLHTPQKLSRFEVDQSIRVEELKNDTIIGLANEENSFAAVLSAKNKHHIYEYFRHIGKPKRFGPITFAAAIICAIKHCPYKIKELLIDIEYPGYEILITSYLKNYFPNLLVYFGVIGKKSPAHHAAYGVHIGKRKPDFKIGLSEIERITKNDPRTVTRAD